MMSLYSTNAVLMIAMAVFYYRAAEFEDGPGLLWAGLSVAISLFTWQVLHFRWVGMLLGQAALLAGITAYRVWRDK
jgi:hypothetical protein